MNGFTELSSLSGPSSPSGGVVLPLTPSAEWGLAQTRNQAGLKVGHSVGTKFLVPICCEGHRGFSSYKATPRAIPPPLHTRKPASFLLQTMHRTCLLRVGFGIHPQASILTLTPALASLCSEDVQDP